MVYDLAYDMPPAPDSSDDEPEVDRLNKAITAVAAVRAKSIADRERIEKAGGKKARAQISKKRTAAREKKLSRLSPADLAKYRKTRERLNRNHRRWYNLHRATAEDFNIVETFASDDIIDQLV